MAIAIAVASTAASAAQAGEPVTVPELRVQRFELVGASAVPQAELLRVLEPWLNRSLTREGLAQAVRALERHYQAERGLVARVTLPPQDITDGVVRLRVAEARFGKLMIQGDAVRSISAERVAAIVNAAQPPQALLRIDAVERATALLNEWPGLGAASSLVAGSQPGETDVALTLHDRRAWEATLRADNEGARATGAARLTADASAVLPDGGGHSVGIGTVLTEGSRLLRLSAGTALGDGGARATLYGSSLSYRLVAPEFNSLDVKGPSSTLGASLDWPVERRSAATSDLSAQVERRRFNNQALGTTLSRYHLDVLTLRGTRQWNSADGQARLAGALGVAAGRVDLRGSPNQIADASTVATAGGYGVLRATLQGAFTVSAEQIWTARLSTQLASKNLDVSERLPIAGPSGVRAYPVGEINGSDALFTSVEWQHALSGIGRADTVLSAFAEAGIARTLHNTGFAGAPGLNRLNVAGAGFWLEWRPANSALVARLTVAQPIGPHPNPTVADTNQDGSRIGTRFWASAQWAL